MTVSKTGVVGMGAGLALLALASCAPISEDECRAGNWDAIGYEDGVKGRLPTRINRYAETCGEIGIAPVQETYFAGRARGLALYCTPENAFDIGKRGNRLNQVCSPAEMSAMRTPHARGLDYHATREDIRELEEEEDEIEDRIRFLRQADETDAVEQEIWSLQRELRRLGREQRRLERAADRLARWP